MRVLVHFEFKKSYLKNGRTSHVFVFFSIWVLFHKHSRITGLQGEGMLNQNRTVSAGIEPGTFGFRAQAANH